MVAVVHRRPCLQHLACCSVNSRHIGSESRFMPTTHAFGAPVREFPSGYCYAVWHEKTRMVWLVATRWRKKIDDMFIRFDTTHERDRQTHRHRAYAIFTLHRAPHHWNALPVSFRQSTNQSPSHSLHFTQWQFMYIIIFLSHLG